jgi:hypothetical protein
MELDGENLEVVEIKVRFMGVLVHYQIPTHKFGVWGT